MPVSTFTVTGALSRMVSGTSSRSLTMLTRWRPLAERLTWWLTLVPEVLAECARDLRSQRRAH